MKLRLPLLTALLAAMVCAAFAYFSIRAGAAEEKRAPTVVELFTSQGCSSCPEANVFMGQLANKPGVIALTFAVDYWDYLGWRDTFAKPEFTQRQRVYAVGINQPGVYTPEIVVDGAHHDSDLKTISSWVSRDAPPASATITAEANAITISGAAPNKPADVWLVSYTPGLVTVPIRRGENAGVKLAHYNVVTKLQRVGMWNGGAQRFAATCGRGCAVIVQSPRGGPVLGALAGV